MNRPGITPDLRRDLESIRNRLTALERVVGKGVAPPAGPAAITVDFTGANGAAWPVPSGAAFAPGATSAGSSATINANRGRIHVGAIAGYGALQSEVFPPTAQNYMITVDMIMNAATVANESLQRLVWRNVDGVQMFALELGSQFIEVFRQDASFGRSVKRNQSGLGNVGGDIWHIKMQVIGNDHQVKWWKNATTEPAYTSATQAIQFTDATLTSGTVGLWGQGGNPAFALDFDFDNFVITYL